MITHERLVFSLMLLALCMGQLLSAPIICGDESTKSANGEVDTSSTSSTTSTGSSKPSELNQFLHNMQCTLEKAKPWVENLEKEAKRLEETAKRVGLSIVHRVGDLVDTLFSAAAAANRRPFGNDGITSTTVATSTTSGVETTPNAISDATSDGNPNDNASKTEKSTTANPSSINLDLIAHEIDEDNEIIPGRPTY